jgi:hypothetical protein
MMPVGPYSPDALTRIINVNWGGDVIVAFAQVNFLVPGPKPFIFLASEDIEFLAQRQFNFVNFPYDGHDAVATLYKVKVNQGEFMDTVTPDLFIDGFDLGDEQSIYVFAIGDDLNKGIERAFTGIAQALYANYARRHDLDDAAPVKPDISPPGMLWSIGMLSVPSGTETAWKIRFGNHRDDDPAGSSADLPNAMVQCYPLGPTYNPAGDDPTAEVFGYTISMYRLDSGGVGTSYGASALGEEPGRNMDPAWHQPVDNAIHPAKGIPFSADPPPLVTNDTPSA